MRSPEQKRMDLEAQWALERSARLAAEAAYEKLSDAFWRQNSSMEFRQTQIVRLRDAEKQYKAQIEALTQERAALEDVLAVTAENLLAYRDYYGTTIAQVKHLQECGDCTQHGTCIDASCPCRPCPDYPTE